MVSYLEMTPLNMSFMPLMTEELALPPPREINSMTHGSQSSWLTFHFPTHKKLNLTIVSLGIRKGGRSGYRCLEGRSSVTPHFYDSQ